MTFELKCENGRLCIDNLCLSKITDLFTVTTVNEDSFCIADGESFITVAADDDDSMVMYFTLKGKMFYCKGCKFAIRCFDSFDIVHLYDKSSSIVFSITIDKVVE